MIENSFNDFLFFLAFVVSAAFPQRHLQFPHTHSLLRFLTPLRFLVPTPFSAASFLSDLAARVVRLLSLSLPQFCSFWPDEVCLGREVLGYSLHPTGCPVFPRILQVTVMNLLHGEQSASWASQGPAAVCANHLVHGNEPRCSWGKQLYCKCGTSAFQKLLSAQRPNCHVPTISQS